MFSLRFPPASRSPERFAGPLAAALAVAMMFGGTAPDDPAAPSTDPPAKENPAPETSEERPERVHLHVDRYEEIGGEVVEEDHDLIQIRTRSGELKTFPKGRLIRVIRLIDVEDPHPGLVEMRDGTILTGDLVSDGYDEVVIRIKGVNTRLERDAVLQARLDLTVEQKYRRYKELLEPNAWLRRFELASWLFDEEKYDLARGELVEIVAETQLPQAIELLRIVEAQIALENDALPPGRSTSRSGRENVGPVDLRDMLPQEILSAEDVNIIRVYEIDFRRPPTRIHVSPETIRELLETYGASKLIPADSAGRTRLFRAEPLEVVDLMFRLKSRELYSRIEVRSEPPALNLFRQKVHDAWLIPNCATSRCHGGLDGGRFFLHRRNSKSERVRYTNLLTLERWNEIGRPLIDYDDPGASLLIQYALPRNEARFPHPEVKGWKPIFSRGNQRLLRDSLAWISSMYRPRPGYPVEYEAPVIAPPELPEPASKDPEAAREGRRDR